MRSGSGLGKMIALMLRFIACGFAKNEAAFRVYKWMMQQHWFRFDFALATKLADYMGKERKYLKCREIFDDIINQGLVPKESTFHILIVAYLSSSASSCLQEACIIYNQMIHLGGYKPRLSLHNSLFRALVSKAGSSCKHHLKQAEFIFHNLTTCGLKIHNDIYGGLIWLHSYQDDIDKERIVSLRAEMKAVGIEESFGRACRHIYNQFHEWLADKLPVDDNDHDDDIPCEFTTISHSYFKFYADQFWPQGIPSIPNLIHRWLTPRILAYWYMYGGYRTSSGDILLKLKSRKEDVQRIAKAFKAKSLNSRIKWKGRVFWVGFLGSDATEFWKLIEPFILADLKASLEAGIKSPSNGVSGLKSIILVVTQTLTGALQIIVMITLHLISSNGGSYMSSSFCLQKGLGIGFLSPIFCLMKCPKLL
ncbi:UNVERIFIED_CONTAM: Pentatricopeptide repeat-containing protein, chloroplastic [Sesamum radiatum]|uniref:Pentatricopeptide repeat-containing protein, chloroplastic n=1 Tax=Sesamum radiatum TaxID=300843 RepID=A0AAW2RV51_SESRA